MPLEVKGMEDLGIDIGRLFEKTGSESRYFENMAKRTLTEGGEIIASEMRKNAARMIDTGTIYKSINVYKVVRHKKRQGFTVKVGVQRNEPGGYYASPLEYGHGGIHGPAAPNPFVRPAFDAKADEAYAKIKKEIDILLFERENT